MDIPNGKALRVRKIVVHADQFFTPIRGLRNCSDVRIALRWQWDHTQQPLYVWVVEIDWNLVVGKRIARRRINRAIRGLDGLAQVSEVSCPFLRRGHELVEAGGDAISTPFLRPEEESLVLTFVVQARNV